MCACVYMCVRVCVYVCVRVRAWVRACVCVTSVSGGQAVLRVLSTADEETQGKGFCPRSHSQWAAGLGLTCVAPKPCASPSPTLFLHLPSTLQMPPKEHIGMGVGAVITVH